MTEHEEYAQKIIDERKRHNDSINSIIEKSGYKKITKEHETIEEIWNENKRIMEEISEILGTVIESLSDYNNRVTIKNSITIRDKGVYKYSSQKIASLLDICRNSEEICDYIREDEEYLSTIMDEVMGLKNQENKVGLLSNFHGFPFHRKNKRKYSNYDFIFYDTRREKIYCYIVTDYPNIGKAYSDGISYSSRVDISSMDRDTVEKCDGHYNEIIDLLQEVKQDFKNKREKLNDIRDRLLKKYSHILMANEI